MNTIVSLVFLILFSAPSLCARLDSASCTFLNARGFCSSVDIQAVCPSHCTPPCSNIMPDSGCNIIKNIGGCRNDTFFPLCRKTCFGCDVLYTSLGCFIDQNGNRIMATTLHQDFNDPNIVKDCSQRASAAGFSVFGVEAGGQCFSGVNAGLSFKKHGQAPDEDCINGEGANFRMSVYKFGTLHQGSPAQGSCDVFLSFKKWLYLNQKVQKAHLTKGILQL
ncbi:uncharacterized protein [Montipora foliosa]|uniref:uncharacterized protein n=1 Tax=Montipora foliosa TaxID=591990 RepID=UPI0035F1DF2E